LLLLPLSGHILSPLLVLRLTPKATMKRVARLSAPGPPTLFGAARGLLLLVPPNAGQRL